MTNEEGRAGAGGDMHTNTSTVLQKLRRRTHLAGGSRSTSGIVYGSATSCEMHVQIKMQLTGLNHKMLKDSQFRLGPHSSLCVRYSHRIWQSVGSPRITAGSCDLPSLPPPSVHFRA